MEAIYRIQMNISYNIKYIILAKCIDYARSGWATVHC
jgi:hypothetical protein